MTTRLSAVFLVIASTALGPGAVVGHPTNLVLNPEFRSTNASGLAADWTPWQPEWEPARCSLRVTPEGLVVDAQAPYAVGGVRQKLGLRGQQAYAIEAAGSLRQVPDPYQAVLVRLLWTRAGETLHPAGVLVRGPRMEGPVARFADVLVAPEEADGAKLSLEVQWPRGGAVTWQHVSVRPCDPPSPRRVRVGTVYLRPRESTPAHNLDLWCEQIDAAGRLNLDIVCLSESILVVGTSARASDVAEPIPGRTTERL
jgi:hypothetical protein